MCSSILHVDIWHELLFSDTAKLWNPFEMDRRVVQLRWKQPVASAWLPTKGCVTEGGNCELFSPSICLHLFQDLASNTLLCKFLKFLFLCILEAFVSMSLEAFVYWQHIGMRIDRTCLSRVKIQILIFFFCIFLEDESYFNAPSLAPTICLKWYRISEMQLLNWAERKISPFLFEPLFTTVGTVALKLL